MSDHAVLIPTAEGAVGGIVSEPECEATAGLILLPGWGSPARSGTNSFWARLARKLALHGFVTLRFDYSREGETLPLGEGGSGQLWKKELDTRLLRQVNPWFRSRLGDVPLFLAGACSGGRLAIELAAREPHDFAAMFLIVPYLRALGDPATAASVDPEVVKGLSTFLECGPARLLVGEHDDEDIDGLRKQLPSTARCLEVETVGGMALHFLDQPAIQSEASRWLTAHLNEVDRPPPSPDHSPSLRE